MDVLLFRTVELLIVAIVVAIIARRLSLPYTVGLVVAGVGLAIAHTGDEFTLTHDFIFDVILPPLLFEAALNIHWSELRDDLLPVLVLSTIGVAVSVAVVAFGLVSLLHWPLAAALIFAVLIAATDPIAVIALFKDIGVKGRLRLLVESESLFNDGVAAVLFTLALSWAQAEGSAAPGSLAMIRALLFTSWGGIAIGLAAGAVAVVVAGRSVDHLVETAVSAVAAYGSFLLAQRLNVSGVLATVVAGLVMGTLGMRARPGRKTLLSERARGFMVAFWEFAAFIANSIVFLLIGATLAGFTFSRAELATIGVAIVLVLAGRALTVYPLCLPFRRSRWRVPMKEQHVLFWGGLRGALALALALALPASMPYRGEILLTTFGVVVFSVIVQGLSMPLLLRLLRYQPTSSLAPELKAPEDVPQA
jgi:CPA1 family monovalent cation:H+ antiporter